MADPFAQTLIKDVDIFANQIAFIICACLGGIAHYLKKVAKGETTATFKEWFGSSNLSATIYTLIVFFFVIIGSLAGDIINSQTGFWAALYTGFATGFAIDAGFNSDSKSLTRGILEVKDETRDLFDDDGRPHDPRDNRWDDGRYPPGPYQPYPPGPWRQQDPNETSVSGEIEQDSDSGATSGKIKVVIRRNTANNG